MKATKAHLENLVRSLEREQTILHQYLSAAQNEQHDAIERAKEPSGARYVLTLWRALGASGGIVHCVYKVTGQKDQVIVLRLDDAAEHLNRDGVRTEYDAAICRLLAVRSSMIAKAALGPGHPPTVEDAQRLISED